MAKIMLVQPWNYHDEGVEEHDLAQEWRNGPYSLLLLAAQLIKHKHQVTIVDLHRDLVVLKGDVEACLNKFSETIREFTPDIIGFGFFSVHYFEVQKSLEAARRACEQIKIAPLFIGGGIHATIEPIDTLRNFDFDYVFVGEADLGIVDLANGQKPETVKGIVNGKTSSSFEKGEEVVALDSLPFPDWSLVDYQFYAYPSYARLKVKQSSSLDLTMSRGCAYRCSFCAYNALSELRFYSAEYLVEQVKYMKRSFNIDGVYFIDSTIGNNRQLVREFCELMIREEINVEWYANIRANQVKDKDFLELMWRAGCRYLFYGFESGSQRVLDLMNKKDKLENYYKVVQWHNEMKFPYNASMILGYPGEREEDILKTFVFLRETRPPSIGINNYVPLPGSQDYYELKAKGIIKTDDPTEWRRIGEVNPSRVYAEVPDDRFRELLSEANRIADSEVPAQVFLEWQRKLDSNNADSPQDKSFLGTVCGIFKRRKA